MLTATVREICDAIGGYLVAGDPAVVVKGLSTDSREIQPGMAFVALKGERFDGHDFIGAALSGGAAAAIGTSFPGHQVVGLRPGQALIQVDDTLLALQKLAAYHRQKVLKGPLIGVTGSSGKTTTKNLIAAVLSPVLKVLKTPGNFNNEIGLPMTLLRLAPWHQAAVVEMAMRGKGEIASLAAIARPTIGVITNIGTTHLGLLGSIANIAAAKGELLAALPAEGLAVLNGDNEWCRRLAATCPCRVVFFSTRGQGEIYARDIGDRGLEGTFFTAVFPGKEVRVQLPVPGRHNVEDALAALAVGFSLGVEPETMARSLADWPAEDLRQDLRPGPGGSLVFNDAYNANPESMEAALQALGALPGRRVAVLGAMLELGPAEVELHRRVGRFAAARGLYRLITVGELAGEIAAGALEAGMPADQVFACLTHEEAAGHLRGLGHGDVVLFKGSRLTGMEKVLAIWEGSEHD
ncbi:UDP-N-acetylmuramoyl-tripeptide--D-alanyl-D-alanine ligase [Neomoorella thermoacetica]|uniref:UDP-N-acetylmuramoyl-tripeptide--D-alanyl-D-alanine ligase n=3 Tax=Neomoorella thermoacetica TaxID=1525 RepID=A0A1J5NKN0_NEOTH|nr:UDP-N-acetylmuramoyl-tripeptide--D-alanyl-D-alanine ligase [Moorella thermoacetica]AKX93589.1 UDP-N-acetylmuramoyl-tripeptide--D-alanyl-D-alanine ligase [Moorella thermoacetica]AKX96236.1 UDP-N-acetylmuramoyl-tripeptide--D-alanyl-D-alanine ligase [Moorella thermoacetica]OIQ09757.1 UDP-N-acetylmuramoyl-tripeptide--D-alanyl-D-alanine ligase [Moorella thermoacetica]OIQ55449.1 UDP-N-acetylmuramoyl-tripeptide--D-alanyl-D-alanine ligase [Moorella thermoacetica]OIQ55700.1 UDP-N-acetylmuramoyl-trip